MIEILGREDGRSIAKIRLTPGHHGGDTALNPAALAEESGYPVSRCPLYLRYKGTGSIELLQFTLF